MMFNPLVLSSTSRYSKDNGSGRWPNKVCVNSREMGHDLVLMDDMNFDGKVKPCHSLMERYVKLTVNYVYGHYAKNAHNNQSFAREEMSVALCNAFTKHQLRVVSDIVAGHANRVYTYGGGEGYRNANPYVRMMDKDNTFLPTTNNGKRAYGLASSYTRNQFLFPPNTNIFLSWVIGMYDTIMSNQHLGAIEEEIVAAMDKYETVIRKMESNADLRNVNSRQESYKNEMDLDKYFSDEITMLMLGRQEIEGAVWEARKRIKTYTMYIELPLQQKLGQKDALHEYKKSAEYRYLTVVPKMGIGDVAALIKDEIKLVNIEDDPKTSRDIRDRVHQLIKDRNYTRRYYDAYTILHNRSVEYVNHTNCFRLSLLAFFKGEEK